MTDFVLNNSNSKSKYYSVLWYILVLIYLVLGSFVRFSSPFSMWGYVCVAAIPTTLLFCVLSAAKAEQRLLIFSSQSWIRAAFSGVTFRIIAAFALGAIFSCLIFVKLLILNYVDITMLLISFAVLPISIVLIKRVVGNEVTLRQRFRIVILWSCGLASMLLLLTHLCLLHFYPNWVSPVHWHLVPSSLLDYRIRDDGLSSGYKLIYHLINQLGDLIDFSLSQIASLNTSVASLLKLVIELGSYNALLLLLAFGHLSISEQRRGLLPLSDENAKSSIFNNFWVPVLLTVLTMGAIKEIARYENFADQQVREGKLFRFTINNPDSLEFRDTHLANNMPQSSSDDDIQLAGIAPLMGKTPVEEIGGQYFVVGTIEALQQQSEIFAELQLKELKEKDDKIRDTFKSMRASVPQFLDWYYSLGGDYARMFHALKGSGGDYLEEQFLLHTKFSNQALQRDLGDIEEAYREKYRVLLENFQSSLLENRVDLPAGQVIKITNPLLDMAKNLESLESKLKTSLTQRTVASGTAGAASGVIAAMVVKKIAAKGTFKVAAKVVVKAIGSKMAGGAGGAAAGSLAGGAIGSFIPVIGTAVGAVVGGVFGGLVGGLAVDKVILEIEEAFGRDQFEAQILEGISEVETQLLGKS